LVHPRDWQYLRCAGEVRRVNRADVAMQWTKIHNISRLQDASDRALVQDVATAIGGRMYQQRVRHERQCETPPTSPAGCGEGITLCVERDRLHNRRDPTGSTTMSVAPSNNATSSEGNVLTGMDHWRYVVSDVSDFHFTLWIGGFGLPMNKLLLSGIERLVGPRLVNVVFSVHNESTAALRSHLICSHMSDDAMTHYKEVMQPGEYSIQIIMLTAVAAQTQNATDENATSDVPEDTMEAVKQQLYTLQEGSPTGVNVVSTLTPTHAKALRENAIQATRRASHPVQLSAGDMLWFGKLCSRIAHQCFDANQPSLRTLGHAYKRSVDTVVPEAMNATISSQKPMIRGKRNPAYPGLQLQITGFQTLRFTTLIDWLYNTYGLTKDQIADYWIAPCTVDVEANLLWFFTTNKTIDALELTIQIKHDKPSATPASATVAIAGRTAREETRTAPTLGYPGAYAAGGGGVHTMEYPPGSMRAGSNKRKVADLYANGDDDPANQYYNSRVRGVTVTGMRGNTFY